MLKWHKNYYRGASVKNISKIRLKLIQGKPVPGIYLITLSENPHNQLEILPALTLWNLLQIWFRLSMKKPENLI